MIFCGGLLLLVRIRNAFFLAVAHFLQGMDGDFEHFAVGLGGGQALQLHAWPGDGAHPAFVHVLAAVAQHFVADTGDDRQQDDAARQNFRRRRGRKRRWR